MWKARAEAAEKRVMECFEAVDRWANNTQKWQDEAVFWSEKETIAREDADRLAEVMRAWLNTESPHEWEPKMRAALADHDKKVKVGGGNL